jgi:hypothetical protein
MKPITRKSVLKEFIYLFILCALFVSLIELFVLGQEYINLKNGESIDFTKNIQTFWYMNIFYSIVWLSILLWRIIFFPTGNDKLFNRIANSNWVKELSLLGFTDIHKQSFIISHIFEFRGMYENIIFTFHNFKEQKHITTIEIYIVLDIDTKIIRETLDWSYMHRDLRLKYDHKNINLSETKLSRTLNITDAFDDKKMWETIQIFVKILNETVYNERKLLDYTAKINLNQK